MRVRHQTRPNEWQYGKFLVKKVRGSTLDITQS
jgi:hypothetical protein